MAVVGPPNGRGPYSCTIAIAASDSWKHQLLSFCKTKYQCCTVMVFKLLINMGLCGETWFFWAKIQQKCTFGVQKQIKIRLEVGSIIRSTFSALIRCTNIFEKEKEMHLSVRMRIYWYIYICIYIYVLVYLSTAIGLTPGGSTRLHQTIHRTSQLTTKQHE
jgi:hypothetical protein